MWYIIRSTTSNKQNFPVHYKSHLFKLQFQNPFLCSQKVFHLFLKKKKLSLVLQARQFPSYVHPYTICTPALAGGSEDRDTRNTVGP